MELLLKWTRAGRIRAKAIPPWALGVNRGMPRKPRGLHNGMATSIRSSTLGYARKRVARRTPIHRALGINLNTCSGQPELN